VPDRVLYVCHVLLPSLCSHLAELLAGDNTVLSHGGAVAVNNRASAQIDTCTCLLTGNTARALDGKGGALYTEGSTNLSNTLLTGNSAGVGGAILLAAGARVRLGKGVSVTGNTARSNGGGIAITSKTVTVQAESANSRGGTYADFQALLAVAKGNPAAYDADVSVPIDKLDIQGNKSVINLTSRLSASEGLIVVAVNVIGWFEVPSQDTEVEAVLAARNLVLATSRTDANGTALFTSLKLQENPGIYDILFRPKGQLQPTAKLVVNVTGCPVGNVRADTGKACIQCPQGSYSFNPDNTTCDVCVANAGEDCSETLPR
jgi:hypothetical protein